MATIDFVYFDLGNVVVNFSHQLACQQLAEVSRVPVASVWAAVFESGLQIRFECGLITCEEFHAEFSEATRSQSSVHELIFAFSDIFSINVPLLPLITELATLNFPRGVLSNTCLSHWQHVTEKYAIVRDLLPVRLLSYEEHSMKPDPEIYQAAIRLAGFEPGRIFFVDDRAENVTGALAAGMDAVLFESVGGLRRELFQRGLNV